MLKKSIKQFFDVHFSVCVLFVNKKLMKILSVRDIGEAGCGDVRL